MTELQAGNLANHAETLLPAQNFDRSDEHPVPRRVTSLHSLSPYIGKMRPELAEWAIQQTTLEHDWILDPFCGSGTVLLEGWINRRNVVGSDLNPYACLLAKAKLFPHKDGSDDALNRLLDKYDSRAKSIQKDIDLRSIPEWVRRFYHPQTLRELLAWFKTLEKAKDHFTYACLLGIAHHQRPGFLSYPASNTVPYLRTSKFPREEYPDMYEYRDVRSRLQRKLFRALGRYPVVDHNFERTVNLLDATKVLTKRKFAAIITSPPYMGQLHYARDNRLRLFFMGIKDWASLDRQVSPNACQFKAHMQACFVAWANILKPQGAVAILVGDTTNSSTKRLDQMVLSIAQGCDSRYELEGVLRSPIPDGRRIRKNCNGSSSESLILLRLNKGLPKA